MAVENMQRGGWMRIAYRNRREPMQTPVSDPEFLPARFQPLLAAVVGVALVAMAIWFVAVGGLRGGLVHHDLAPASDVVFTVDINTAGVEELAQLPGLGPSTAQRVVLHRTTRGPFTSIDGLLDVPGIGPATLEQLRRHVRPIGAGETP
jgi:competence ComEA-like helix-hairpin-helix protein